MVARENVDEDLQVAVTRIDELEAANATLTAAAAAAHALAAQGGPGADVPPGSVPRPHGRFNIRDAMGVDHEQYKSIQRTVRDLIIQAQVDWTDDFRRQDPTNLARLYKAAIQVHPVLARYYRHWATAELAKQYMANKRKHAYKNAYIPKKPRSQRGSQAGPAEPAGTRTHNEQSSSSSESSGEED
ncbi:hypothetical protein EUX98_g9004 [Antrodiella citrinella]|uniref:Uncharacterized protein n=1 Tax=Antrodiella citrinella TaxID=2447956 RepID=A0A4S4M1F6_9APHY|nr:hypothetical protein EUX98_g9004 [Antrodiella citrinella]